MEYCNTATIRLTITGFCLLRKKGTSSHAVEAIMTIGFHLIYMFSLKNKKILPPSHFMCLSWKVKLFIGKHHHYNSHEFFFSISSKTSPWLSKIQCRPWTYQAVHVNLVPISLIKLTEPRQNIWNLCTAIEAMTMLRYL